MQNNYIERLAHAVREVVEFPLFLQIARVTKGMSPLELAAEAHICKSTLSALEKGKRIPRSEVLGKLADALELGTRDRSYFLSLWAEEQIKAGERRRRKKHVQQPYKKADITPNKRADITPMTEEEKTAFEKITGRKF